MTEMTLEFDYTAIAIYIVILVAIIRRKLYHGRTNKLFLTMVITSIVVTLCDFLPYVAFSFPLVGVSWYLYTGLFYLYFYLRNLTILLYLLFCFSCTRMWYRLHSIFMKVAFVLPYSMVVVLVTSNVFHHRIFIITPEGGYSRGDLMIALYAISMLYLLYIIFFLAYCRGKRFLEHDKWRAMSTLVIFSGIAVVVQLVRSDYLVEMFSTALTMMCVLLFIQKPEDLVDSINGVMNFGLYQREVRKVLNTGESAQLFLINYKNASAVRDFLGEQEFDQMMLERLKAIVGFFRATGHDFDIFYEQPGFIYIVMDNSNDILSREKTDDFARRVVSDAIIDERKGLTLEAKMAVVFAPDDMADEESIINFGHRFTQFIGTGKSVVWASDVVGTTDFHIFNRMDEILRQAIATGSFEMYYQPIYSIKEGRFVSAEALIRLRDPDYGIISPGVFIPEAEQRHLMQAIGVHVLHDVTEFIGSEEFKRLGMSYIELNLSVQQCVDKNIVDDIISYQRKYKVQPSQINLEITETDYADDANNLDENLSELAEAGFALSLDDYGTGYSNMQRILRLPLKLIKIDKSMVDEMETEKGERLVKNTIRLMQDIGMEIVAEGVEHREQYEKLVSMGCDFIQGYYFAKPMPREEFVNFIADKMAV